MKAVDPNLRLSAQRALLGAIHPAIRMVKVRRDADRITLSAVCDLIMNDLAVEALQIAATEIAADFPMCKVEEKIIRSADPLPREDVLAEGWIFQRAQS